MEFTVLAIAPGTKLYTFARENKAWANRHTDQRLLLKYEPYIIDLEDTVSFFLSPHAVHAYLKLHKLEDVVIQEYIVIAPLHTVDIRDDVHDTDYIINNSNVFNGTFTLTDDDSQLVEIYVFSPKRYVDKHYTVIDNKYDKVYEGKQDIDVFTQQIGITYKVII